MSDASVKLVKQAVNRARALLRAGELSAEAISKLRRVKALPSIAKNVKGLEHGTDEILRKLPISGVDYIKVQPNPFGSNFGIYGNSSKYIPGKTLPIVAQFTPASNQMSNSSSAIGLISIPKIVKRFPEIKKFNPDQLKQLTAISRRHEAEEISAGRNIIRAALKRKNLPEVLKVKTIGDLPSSFSEKDFDKLMKDNRNLSEIWNNVVSEAVKINKKKLETLRPVHNRPSIVYNELGNARGLSDKLERFFKKVRGGYS